MVPAGDSANTAPAASIARTFRIVSDSNHCAIRLQADGMPHAAGNGCDVIPFLREDEFFIEIIFVFLSIFLIGILILKLLIVFPIEVIVILIEELRMIEIGDSALTVNIVTGGYDSAVGFQADRMPCLLYTSDAAGEL